MELDEWTRWWSARGEPGLRTLMMVLWDPIGVLGEYHASDEYDTYVLQVGRRLREGASAEEIANYLMAVETDVIGFGGDRAHTFQAARKIVAWYGGETGDRDPPR